MRISGILDGSPSSLMFLILCVLACAFGLQRTPTVLDRCRSNQPLASWLDATELMELFVDSSLSLLYCLQQGTSAGGVEATFCRLTAAEGQTDWCEGSEGLW